MDRVDPVIGEEHEGGFSICHRAEIGVTGGGKGIHVPVPLAPPLGHLLPRRSGCLPVKGTLQERGAVICIQIRAGQIGCQIRIQEMGVIGLIGIGDHHRGDAGVRQGLHGRAHIIHGPDLDSVDAVILQHVLIVDDAVSPLADRQHIDIPILIGYRAFHGVIDIAKPGLVVQGGQKLLIPHHGPSVGVPQIRQIAGGHTGLHHRLMVRAAQGQLHMDAGLLLKGLDDLLHHRGLRILLVVHGILDGHAGRGPRGLISSRAAGLSSPLCVRPRPLALCHCVIGRLVIGCLAAGGQ